MSILFTSNRIHDVIVSGTGVVTTNATLFFSGHVGSGIQTKGSSSQIDAFDIYHKETATDTTWIHAVVAFDREHTGSNGTGTIMFRCFDVNDNSIFEFDINSGTARISVFGTSQINDNISGQIGNGIPGPTTFDVKIVMDANITVIVYRDGGAVPIAEATAVRNGQGMPAREKWRCWDWRNSGSNYTQTTSEMIIADEDTRGLFMTDKFTMAAGALEQWNGNVSNIADGSTSTLISATEINLKFTRAISAYTGPSSALVRGLFSTVYCNFVTAGDIRMIATKDNEEYFTGKFGVISAQKPFTVGFDTNPIASTPWNTSEFTDFEIGIKSIS